MCVYVCQCVRVPPDLQSPNCRDHRREFVTDGDQGLVEDVTEGFERSVEVNSWDH